MKPLIIITNNSLIAEPEYLALGMPAGSLDIRCSVSAVLALPKGTEIIIERYGVGTVKCEICTAADVLVRLGEVVLLDKSKLPTREKYHEPANA